jgi:hypothetical protein
MSRRAILGWVAVGISTVLSSLWAFWGVFESFHEGWYFESLTRNLVLTVKYLTLMLSLVALSVTALRWPRVGGAVYQLSGAGFCIWILTTRRVLNLGVVLSWMPVTLPLLVLGALFWVGRPRPLGLAYKISLFVPLAVAVGTAAEPVARIAGRVDDGDRGQRMVEGNGVKLIWAPEGPGWPKPDPDDETWRTRWRGPTWKEAREVTRRLAADGETLASTPQDIWRLPTIDEVVRSMARHGVNCEGVWDPARGRASYATRPDKEPPLWNPHSVIIYWWTSSEESASRAYCIDFKGNVYSRDKTSTLGSQGFRAVRDPQTDAGPAEGVARSAPRSRREPLLMGVAIFQPDTRVLLRRLAGKSFDSAEQRLAQMLSTARPALTPRGGSPAPGGARRETCASRTRRWRK